MSWTDIGIAPVNVVYFGDGRPLSAGETDHGEGRFPPSPRTMQGVVRTTLLRSVAGLDLGTGADGGRIADLVGPPEKLPDGWQIAGPWLAQWAFEEGGHLDGVAPWLPLPRYALDRTAATVKPLADTMKWDGDRPEAVISADNEAFRPGYIGPTALRALLAGAVPAERDVCRDGEPEHPVRPEPRVGLRIEPGKEIAQEGMLYALGYRRLADDAGFVLRFRGDVSAKGMDVTALSRGMASIGGRNRLARLLAVRTWDGDFEAALCDDHLPAEPAEGQRFWLWTTTPAAVDKPWDPVISPSAVGEAKLSVVAAAVGHLEPIGGFSLAEGRGSPVQGFAPAGAAWLLELRGGSPRERGTLLRSLHDGFPLGTDLGLRTMGFGHTLVSLVPFQRT